MNFNLHNACHHDFAHNNPHRHEPDLPSAVSGRLGGDRLHAGVEEIKARIKHLPKVDGGFTPCGTLGHLQRRQSDAHLHCTRALKRWSRLPQRILAGVQHATMYRSDADAGILNGHEF